MKFPSYEEMARSVAEKALDEIEYNGKTIRQWIEFILATDTNVGELISRQAAIDALENDKAALDKIIKGMSAEDMLLKYYVAQHNQVSCDIDAIVQLSPIQPKRGDGMKEINITVIGNKVNLCESCKFDYPECPSRDNDVFFGDGIGNDNICCCAYYDPIERKKQGGVTDGRN